MFFFFSSRRRHTRSLCDWSSDVCSSDLDGAQVVAYDPAAGDLAARQVSGLQLADKAVEVADGAHAIVLMTEWAEFSELDPADLRGRMAYPILVDARNALDADAFVAAGFTVAGVGRPVRAPDGSR